MVADDVPGVMMPPWSQHPDPPARRLRRALEPADGHRRSGAAPGAAHPSERHGAARAAAIPAVDALACWVYRALVLW